MGGGVGGFPTRSRRIKMDQEGSGQIKGDHCDGWGCRWVSNQIKEDQDRSKKIKEDQDGSRWIKGDHSDLWVWVIKGDHAN